MLDLLLSCMEATQHADGEDAPDHQAAFLFIADETPLHQRLGVCEIRH